MIIQSKFKDYYDYVGHTYGSDPLVRYIREPLTAFNEHGFRLNLTVKAKLDFLIPDPRPPHPGDTPRYNYKVLVVMDTAYLLQTYISVRTDISYEYDRYYLYDWITDPQKLKKHHWWREAGDNLYANSTPRDCVIELTKLVGQPVFIIDRIGVDYQARLKGGAWPASISIESNIPILGEYGFAALFPSTKLFQDLTYFIGNTMHSNPDRAPPVEVSNDDRLVQHGFDKKTSFRHRTP